MKYILEYDDYNLILEFTEYNYNDILKKINSEIIEYRKSNKWKNKVIYQIRDDLNDILGKYNIVILFNKSDAEIANNTIAGYSKINDKIILYIEPKSLNIFLLDDNKSFYYKRLPRFIGIIAHEMTHRNYNNIPDRGILKYFKNWYNKLINKKDITLVNHKFLTTNKKFDIFYNNDKEEEYRQYLSDESEIEAFALETLYQYRSLGYSVNDIKTEINNSKTSIDKYYDNTRKFVNRKIDKNRKNKTIFNIYHYYFNPGEKPSNYYLECLLRFLPQYNDIPIINKKLLQN